MSDLQSLFTDCLNETLIRVILSNPSSKDGVIKICARPILKERMAALMTDGLRAQILEANGYRTQILEFIDMAHTPKNLLIRAVYNGHCADNKAQINELLAAFDINPTLYRLLCKKDNTISE